VNTLKLATWKQSQTLMNLAQQIAPQCHSASTTVCSQTLSQTLASGYGTWSYSLVGNYYLPPSTTVSNSLLTTVQSQLSSVFNNLQGQSSTLLGVGYADKPNASGSNTLRWWILIWSTTTPSGPNAVTTLSNDKSKKIHKPFNILPQMFIVDSSSSAVPHSVKSPNSVFEKHQISNTLEEEEEDTLEGDE
jgi:hypothetical protein